MTEGVQIGIENISILAIANDLVFLAKNGEIAEKQSIILNKYSE